MYDLNVLNFMLDLSGWFSRLYINKLFLNILIYIIVIRVFEILFFIFFLLYEGCFNLNNLSDEWFNMNVDKKSLCWLIKYIDVKIEKR